MAGLGVVLSPCCCANLDLTLPFISVIPEERLDDLTYVREVIKQNREISVKMREQIREYALRNFAWNGIVKKFLTILESKKV